MLKLRKPYPGVRKDNRRSYGGNQMWAETELIRSSGCGPVAALDLLHYLGDKPLHEPIALDRYNSELRDLCRRYLPLIPHSGINGVSLAWGVNRLFRKRGLPYHASWAWSGEKLWPRVREMLERDMPVILSVGPNFPAVWRKERLPFYVRRPDGSYVCSTAAKSHYVTVTGLDDEWAQIASWGREYYINRREYDAFVRQHSASLFSNILYVKRTD